MGVCSGLASAAQRGATDLGSLLPDRWAASHPEHVRQHRLDESRPRVARQKAVRERRRAKARRRRGGHRRKRRCRLMSRIERLAAARSRIGGRPLGVATRGRRYGLRGRCAHRRLATLSDTCSKLIRLPVQWPLGNRSARVRKQRSLRPCLHRMRLTRLLSLLHLGGGLGCADTWCGEPGGLRG